jgi:hypothetical protein
VPTLEAAFQKTQWFHEFSAQIIVPLGETAASNDRVMSRADSALVSGDYNQSVFRSISHSTMEIHKRPFVDSVKADLQYFKNVDYRLLIFHIKVLITRNFCALFHRKRLILGGLALHLLLVSSFYLFMEDASDLTSPVIAFFSLSSSVLLASNLYWSAYLLKYNEVFERINSDNLSW